MHWGDVNTPSFLSRAAVSTLSLYHRKERKIIRNKKEYANVYGGASPTSLWHKSETEGNLCGKLTLSFPLGKELGTKFY